MPDSPKTKARLPLHQEDAPSSVSQAKPALVATNGNATVRAVDTEQSGREGFPQDADPCQGASKHDSPVQERDGPGDSASTHADVVKSGTNPDAQGNGVGRAKMTTVKEDDISAISDDEDVGVMGRNIGADLYYNNRATPLKDRTKKAHKRVLQQIEYSKLVEDRIVDLENRLGALEGRGLDVDSGNDALEDEGDEGDDKAILGLNRVSFEEYRPKKDSIGNRHPVKNPWSPHARPDAAATSPRHLIDVVTNSTVANDHFGSGVASAETIQTADSFVGTDRILAAEGLRYDTPDRIRINSPLLLEVLTKVTGQKFTATVYSSESSELKSQVILRPFKVLVVHEEAIRSYTNRLAKKFEVSGKKSHVDRSDRKSDGLPSQFPVVDSALDLESSDGLEDAEALKVQPMTQAETKRTEEAERLESKRCLQEMQVLVELLDNDLKSTFELRRQIDEGTLQSIAFSDLWHLFRHGDDIRGSEGHSRVYRILNVTGGRRSLLSKEDATEALSPSEGADFVDNFTFTISCFYYSSDGERLGTVLETFQIKSYNDPKLVTSLTVFPVRFAHAKSGNLGRAEFVRRGRRYIELAGSKLDVVHKTYNGLTLDLEQLREEVDSEVILDTAMALLKNPSLRDSFGISSLPQADRRETTEFLDPECRRRGCHENTVIHQDYDVDLKLSASVLKDTSSDWDPSEDRKGMQDADYILCPNNMYGYVLRSRKWVSLDINLVQDTKKHSGGFDSLVLPTGHRDTLLALVETHSRGKRPDTGRKAIERQIDLVRGKGKGLIILLHGEPGVGKTSTAECVAEHTGRPLFQVTCGDIGESAEAVEKTLENHFQLAHRWGCVLLLDEADVFLMRRGKTDLKRNAIVSVFLRVLEYYSGILFLTTNRVGVFDQAFRSRIHMSFFYPKLGQEATIEIWKMNLQRTQEQWGDSIKITTKDYADILKHADEHYKELEVLMTTWNGRQIRNAFQTAIALAEYDAHQAQINFDLAQCPKPVLKVAQFEKVAEASKHFDEYLRQTAGLESDLAQDAGERRDELDQEKIKEQIAEQTRRAQRL